MYRERDRETYPSGKGAGGVFSPPRSSRLTVLAAALPVMGMAPTLQAS